MPMSMATLMFRWASTKPCYLLNNCLCLFIALKTTWLVCCLHRQQRQHACCSALMGAPASNHGRCRRKQNPVTLLSDIWGDCKQWTRRDDDATLAEIGDSCEALAHTCLCNRAAAVRSNARPNLPLFCAVTLPQALVSGPMRLASRLPWRPAHEALPHARTRAP